MFIHAQPGLTIEHPAGDVSIHSLHSENAINFGESLTLAADSDIQKALDFNGDLDQIAGALALNGGGTITGNFHTETAGASFDFLAGKFTDNGSMFDGEGGTQVGGTGQQVVYLAPLPPQPASPEVTTHRDNFELAKGGIIEKGGTWVQAAKTFTWTGGTMRGTGVTQINFGATLTITGADTKTLDGRSLQSIGQVSATGGDIEVSNGAVLTNQFLGTFTLAGANIVQKGKVLGSFVNESVVQQTVGTTISIDFVNKGTVLANNPNDLTFITKRK